MSGERISLTDDPLKLNKITAGNSPEHSVKPRCEKHHRLIDFDAYIFSSVHCSDVCVCERVLDYCEIGTFGFVIGQTSQGDSVLVLFENSRPPEIGYI